MWRSPWRKRCKRRRDVHEKPGRGGAGDGGAKTSDRRRAAAWRGAGQCRQCKLRYRASRESTPVVQTCVAAAERFHCIFDEVFPSSTGIIGVPFPGEKVVAALPAVKAALGSTPAHAELFAQAIMTTDTKMKVARAVGGCGWRGGADLRRGEGGGDDSSATWCACGASACDDAGLSVYGS